VLGCIGNASAIESHCNYPNQASQLDHLYDVGGRDWPGRADYVEANTTINLNNGGYRYKNSQFTIENSFLHASLQVVIKAQIVGFVVQLFGSAVVDVVGILICQC